MLRRLGSGAALIATAAMVLAGCTPPEPVETTDADVVAHATRLINRFYEIVDAQFAAEAASPESFHEVAQPELASAYASEVQTQIDEGVSSRGVPRVTDVVLVERRGVDLFIDFCTDGTSVETTTPAGPVAGQTVAWSTTLSNSGESGLLMSTLDVRGDESLCGQ